MAAKWDAYKLEALAAVQGYDLAAARLHHELDFFRHDALGGVILKPLVGEGALSPSAVGEAESGVLVRKVGRRRLDDCALKARINGAFASLSLNQVMHRAH